MFTRDEHLRNWRKRLFPHLHRAGVVFRTPPDDDGVGGGPDDGAGDDDPGGDDDGDAGKKTYTKEEVEAAVKRRLAKQSRKYNRDMKDLQDRMARSEATNSALSKFLQKQGIVDEDGNIIDEAGLDDDEADVEDAPVSKKRRSRKLDSDINSLLERLGEQDEELAGALRAQYRKLSKEGDRREQRLVDLETRIQEREETMRNRGLLASLQSELAKLEVHDPAIAADHLASYADYDEDEGTWFLRVPDPDDPDETLVVPIVAKEIDEYVPAWFKKPRGRQGSGASSAAGADSDGAPDSDALRSLKVKRDALFARAQKSGSDSDMEAYLVAKKQYRQAELESGKASVKDVQNISRPDMPEEANTVDVRIR